MVSEKKRDAEASMKKILDAGKEVFSEKGYHAATLSEIARRCGLSRATPSYFFENKENLYREVIKMLIDDERDFVSQLNYDGEVTEAVLRELLSKYVDYTFENPYLAKMIIRESLAESMHKDVQALLPNLNWYSEFIQAGKDNGIIKASLDANHLRFNAMVMVWMPIITNGAFMKLNNIDIKASSFAGYHKEQITTVLFESILN